MDKNSYSENIDELNLESLIDPRKRELKIYTDCFDILLEENLNPENSDICLRIIDLCIRLDRELETNTLPYREKNGTPYTNGKGEDKEVKIKPIEYKRLYIHLSEAQRLLNIYTDKYNERQIQDREKELASFSLKPNMDLFNVRMNELKALYDMTEKDCMYITHWLTNVKRTILKKEVVLPQILCFTNIKQFTGKSMLASILAKIINKRIITTDLQKLSARFRPLSLTTEAVLWIDELKKIDKNISDNIKALITNETIDIERKCKDIKQYRKMASIIMSINYDPSHIFFEDETQRRIGIIHLNKYTQKKTRAELETLIKSIWDNSPIEYSIDPDMIAEITFNERKEDSILENFACEGIREMFKKDKSWSITKIQNNLYSYTGGRAKLKTFLKNEEYFIQDSKTNGILLFKATDTFLSLLDDLLKDNEEPIDYWLNNNLQKAV